ncbi:MAG: GldG family protein [Clostridia bacterium]|nr:GldG family protein [Clostridia bacterium]
MKNFKLPKFAKSDKIKNEALFKRGTYSAVITAVVLIGIIVFNVLLSALSSRIMLEYDMTSDKVNTVTAENVKFIKEVDEQVAITMCAKAQDYYGGMMTYYAQNLYGITEDYSSYYKQTVNLIERYNDYNNKIKVEFVDTQDASFTEITAKYSKESLSYGDIIVSCKQGNSERYKIVRFKDIYNVVTDDSYAAYYGYSLTTIEGNDIETALTSAVAYVTSSETKKVAFITGHSKDDYSENYRSLLKTNNYEIDVISDALVSKISSNYDAIFIVAPTVDFIESELSAIADFLDNGEKYGKGLVFVGDASAPYLPNFYGFLEEWGIEVMEGILFETNSQNYMPDKPTVMGSYPASEDSITNGVSLCISGSNIIMNPAFSSNGDTKVETLICTPGTVVNAPTGTSDTWNGAGEYKKSTYSTVIKSERTAYDSDNNLLKNTVIAFSSIDFIHSEYAESTSVGNKDIAFAAAERVSGAEETGISFVTKVITNESFASSVTQSALNTIYIIFMIALPVLCIAAGIYVYIRRKNS